MVIPLTHSVASDEDAMADPHPNVLNLASSMMPVSLILSCSFSDVAARRRFADQARPHAGVVLLEAPDVARVLVVVQNFFTVCHDVSSAFL